MPNENDQERQLEEAIWSALQELCIETDDDTNEPIGIGGQREAAKALADAVTQTFQKKARGK